MPDITTTDVNKIDAEAVDGLAGTDNSLAYKVHEIEKHFHNWERWIGAAVVPSGETHIFDIDSMTPFHMDAGNDTWGSWIQIVGSTDFPIAAGMVKRDAHRFLIADVEVDTTITRIQMIGGESADIAANLAAGNYTEFMTIPLKNSSQTPIDIMTGRALSAVKGWARCWVNGANTGTVDFFLGVHEYPG